MSQSPGNGSPRPVARPFVSGRAPAAASVAAAPRPRPFAPASAERAPAIAPEPSPVVPGWSVVEYRPGMHEGWVAPRLEAMAPPIDDMPAPLEVAPPAIEATVSDWGATDPEFATTARACEAADVLSVVADRLRRGEIQLAADATLDSEAAVVASVLTALLGARR